MISLEKWLQAIPKIPDRFITEYTNVSRMVYYSSFVFDCRNPAYPQHVYSVMKKRARERLKKYE